MHRLRRFLVLLVVLSSLFSSLAIGTVVQAAGVSVTPDVYDPNGTGQVVSNGSLFAGENDPLDTAFFRQGLFFAKYLPTNANAAALATVNGVAGQHVAELGFDYRVSGYQYVGWCGAGAPRFNVVTNDNVTHFLGCAAGTKTPVAGQSDPWNRVRFNPASAFPPILPASTIKALSLVFDEGTDVGSGNIYLDNIDINGVIVRNSGTF